MNRYGLVLVAVFAAAGFVAVGYHRARLPAQEKPAAGQPPADGAEAGVKKATAEYEKAFNAADAKAAAALWTAEGEYVGDDGEVVRGRGELEKSFTEFFKAHPKATVEVQVGSVRAIGRGTATVEGSLKVKLSGEASPVESWYTALHVLEDGVWRAASVREWVPDPATAVTPKHLEWLVGEWAARGDGGEVTIAYAWDEDKVFLHGKYKLTKDGKTVSSGMQVIGVNAAGGLRSWMFDSTGTTSDAVWTRDDNRWVSEAVGALPDGTEITSVSVIVPLGPDSFTWQTTSREADGVPLPVLPPVKVTRVKK